MFWGVYFDQCSLLLRYIEQHSRVLCRVLQVWKNINVRYWLGWKGKKQKRKGDWESKWLQCVRALHLYESHLQESGTFRTVLSSCSSVPCDLGWVLGRVTDGSPRSFFLVTCLLPASGFVIPLMLTSAVFLQSLISGLWCICSEGGHRDFGWQQMVNLQAATGYTGVKLET